MTEEEKWLKLLKQIDDVTDILEESLPFENLLSYIHDYTSITIDAIKDNIVNKQ